MVRALLSIVIWLFGAAAVVAQNDLDPAFDFDASALSKAEKSFLQSALAFEGDYNALVDGAWGRGSQSAMEAYSKRVYDAEPSMWHAAVLANQHDQFLATDGWNIGKLGQARHWFLRPADALTAQGNNRFFDIWSHNNSSLEIGITNSTDSRDQLIHSFVGSLIDNRQKPYTVRKTNLRITSVLSADGKERYLRSDKINDSGASVLLVARPQDENLIAGIAASLSTRNPGQLSFDRNGEISEASRDLSRSLGSDALFDPQIIKQQIASFRRFNPGRVQPRSGPSNAMGFVVNSQGFVMTSHALAQSCRNPRIEGEPAAIFAVSETYDLALFRSEGALGKEVVAFATESPRIEDAVQMPRFVRSSRNFSSFETEVIDQSVDGDPIYMGIDAFGATVGAGLPVIRPNGRVIGITSANLDNRFASVDYPVSQGALVVRSEFARLFMLENGVFPLVGSKRWRSNEINQKLNKTLVRISCN